MSEQKHNLKKRFEGTARGFIKLWEREARGDPRATARAEAGRRRAGYTEHDLDTQTVTLRQYFDKWDELEGYLYDFRAQRAKTHLMGLDQVLSTSDARGNQRGIQRRADKLKAQVEDLEAQVETLKAEVAKLTQERDAARAALLGIDPAEAHS